MEIISGEHLVQKLRNLCDNMKKRLWIASPFIGNCIAVRKILGRKWMANDAVDVKLLTDISDNGNINPDTFKCFRDRGEIKSIKGLHAKVYIVDDFAVISSANLTSTAFSKRYEVGIFLSDKQTQSLLNLYSDWWHNISEGIPLDWTPRISRHKSNKEEGTFDKKLKKLWSLPSDPGGPFGNLFPKFCDYEKFLKFYRDFANIYAEIQRLWPDRSLFFETDAFLNYLFHYAGKPSQKYQKGKPRNLDSDKRKKEIVRYASLFKKWISEGSEGMETNNWRKESSQKIRNLLVRDKIETLRMEEIKQVVSELNCMKSMAINKSRFVNPKNNDIGMIRNAWRNLLYGLTPLQTRMNKCKSDLKFFGRSSIHELLGFFEPEKYPIRNSNSSAGLRFFGYPISAY